MKEDDEAEQKRVTMATAIATVVAVTWSAAASAAAHGAATAPSFHVFGREGNVVRIPRATITLTDFRSMNPSRFLRMYRLA